MMSLDTHNLAVPKSLVSDQFHETQKTLTLEQQVDQYRELTKRINHTGEAHGITRTYKYSAATKLAEQERMCETLNV